MVPPERALHTVGYQTSVQRLIDEWHEQDDLHALIRGPPILTIQAGRFDFRQLGRNSEAVKRRFKIAPETHVVVPAFREGLLIEHVRYQLPSILIHWGAAPNAGHYTALLHNVASG